MDYDAFSSNSDLDRDVEEAATEPLTALGSGLESGDPLLIRGVELRCLPSDLGMLKRLFKN